MITLVQPAASSLALATVLATYLGYQCFKDPRRARGPAKKASTSDTSSSDSLKRLRVTWILYNYGTFVILSGIIRCVLTLAQPSQPSIICPYPENLSPRLFSWSMYNVLSLLLTTIGGALRMVVYRQLGKNYSFELNKPDRLVTDGIYHYIQHPGYTAGWTCVLGILLFFGRFDGGLGCYVPGQLSQMCSGLNIGIVSLAMISVFQVRVKEEETMLKETFGEQWIRYHERTKRFLPWIV